MQEIAELDKEQGMVWKFIQPFFSLMSSRHAPIRQMSGFILATLSQTGTPLVFSFWRSFPL
jgi:hypothetical protein